MLKTFTEKIYKQLVDIDDKRTIFSDEQRDAILYAAKRVRVKDYVLEFKIKDGQFYSDTVTTTANWYFVLTNVAVYTDTKGASAPLVGIKFQNFYPTSPLGTKAEDINNVPYDLVFGREGFGQFEEYKNLYYSLGERVTVNVDVKHRNASDMPQRLFVSLSGIEVNLQDEGVD